MEPVTFELNSGADLTGFRRAVRMLTLCSTRPELITWRTREAPDLFGSQDSAAYGAAGKPITLPKPVAELIKLVICHSDPEKYALLYRLVWRITNGDKEKRILELKSDELVRDLELMAKSVRRDIHQMHISLRFRQVDDGTGDEHFVAWFEPEHYIVEATAQFFLERFTSMIWTILTPKGSLHWDRKELRLGPPAVKNDAPGADAFEAGWRSYCESTFNPPRTNLQVMRQLMPKTYWSNMPETQAIPDLVRNAASRLEDMIERETEMPAKRNTEKAVPAEGPIVTGKTT